VAALIPPEGSWLNQVGKLFRKSLGPAFLIGLTSAFYFRLY
jgi:hypothetical protein